MAMLNIQKIIILLDDYQFEQLAEYLKSINAELPYKLIFCYRTNDLDEISSDEICRQVYGVSDEKTKKKFFQLAYHTFNLSGFISKNFPSFLLRNVALMENLVSENKHDKAFRLAHIVVDIAQKVNDIVAEIAVRKFLSNYYHLFEHSRDSYNQILVASEKIHQESLFLKIYAYIREHFNIRVPRNDNMISPEQHQSFFEQYTCHESLPVQIISEYGYLLSLATFNTTLFYQNETYNRLLALEKKYNDEKVLVLPYLEDLNFKISYLKLQYMRDQLDFDSILKETEIIVENTQHVQFWGKLLNMPEFFSIAVQASYYTTKYYESYKKENQRNKINQKVRFQIEYLKRRCVKHLENDTFQEKFIIRYINLSTIYTGLQLLGTEKEIKDAIGRMENILITYQQIPFHRYIDGIFTNLIAGYFALGNYKMVNDSFKRYKKLSHGVYHSIDNELTMQSFYLCAQWLQTKRNQYLTKQLQVMEQIKSNPNMQATYDLVHEIIQYFSIPVFTE